MAALAWPSMIWTAFTCAPAAIARLAAVCRSSCGTRPGTLLAVAAQSKLRSRNPWTRSTSPHCEVNRRSSGDLPAMRTATARGSGTACACGADGGSSTPAAGFDGSRRPCGLTEHGRENVVGLPGCGGGHLSAIALTYRVHFRRSVLALVPKGNAEMVAASICMIFA
jgi:hypothetical protein